MAACLDQHVAGWFTWLITIAIGGHGAMTGPWLHLSARLLASSPWTASTCHQSAFTGSAAQLYADATIL